MERQFRAGRRCINDRNQSLTMNDKLRMKRIFILYLFSLFFFHYSFLSAQNRKIDSLRTILKSAETDTGKVSAINALCEVMWRTGNYDSAMANALHAKALAEKIITSLDLSLIHI